MSLRFRLSRRAVLRGGGAAVALPLLEAMTPLGRRAYAAAPRRLLIFFSPNGHIRDAWNPTGEGTSFQLARSMMPLAAYRDDLVILDGVDNVAATKGLGDDHMRGMGSMLTGQELLPGTIMGGSGTPAGLAAGISVDQELVRVLKPTTRFSSLELGVRSGSQGTPWGYSNYRGANQPLPLENNPQVTFDRVFKDLGQDQTALVRLRQQKKSVLDGVTRSYRQLAAKLGAHDRGKLEAHLATVEDVEKRLLAGLDAGGATAACSKPALPALDFRANDKFPEAGRLQMDLMVMAMACDLTRVGTVQYMHSVGDVRFTWLGLTRGHHDLSHDPDSNLETKESLTRIDTWFVEQFAYLLGKLKQIPEEGGTMLDNTLVLWVNELSRGNSHSHPEMPYLIAGRAGGRIKTGRVLKYGQVPHNNLLVSVLNAFDVPATTFGKPDYCTGALLGLVG